MHPPPPTRRPTTFKQGRSSGVCPPSTRELMRDIAGKSRSINSVKGFTTGPTALNLDPNAVPNGWLVPRTTRASKAASSRPPQEEGPMTLTSGTRMLTTPLAVIQVTEILHIPAWSLHQQTTAPPVPRKKYITPNSTRAPSTFSPRQPVHQLLPAAPTTAGRLGREPEAAECRPLHHRPPPGPRSSDG